MTAENRIGMQRNCNAFIRYLLCWKKAVFSIGPGTFLYSLDAERTLFCYIRARIVPTLLRLPYYTSRGMRLPEFRFFIRGPERVPPVDLPTALF